MMANIIPIAVANSICMGLKCMIPKMTDEAMIAIHLFVPHRSMCPSRHSLKTISSTNGAITAIHITPSMVDDIEINVSCIMSGKFVISTAISSDATPNAAATMPIMPERQSTEVIWNDCRQSNMCSAKRTITVARLFNNAHHVILGNTI